MLKPGHYRVGVTSQVPWLFKEFAYNSVCDYLFIRDGPCVIVMRDEIRFRVSGTLRRPDIVR